MNRKSIVVTVLLAFVSLTVAAQDTKDAAETSPGWLWEISGNGLQQKSYLFGTCHGEGHDFTREELLGINGLDDALNDVKAVLFEGGMNTEISKTDSVAITRTLQADRLILSAGYSLEWKSMIIHSTAFISASWRK